MADDLVLALTRFHREVFLPDLQRTVDDLRLEMNERFGTLNAHFEAVDQRFDRLERIHTGLRAKA